MSVVSHRVGADLAEIEAVYRERFPELERVAAAITGSRESARDVVQDACARAVHRRSEFAAREASRDGSGASWSPRRVTGCGISRCVRRFRWRLRRMHRRPSMPGRATKNACVGSWHACLSVKGWCCSSATTPISTKGQLPKRSESAQGRWARRSLFSVAAGQVRLRRGGGVCR
jgi:hypothetical protein